MPYSVATLPSIGDTVAPNQVHDILREHMLVDGFHVVPDYRASEGSRLVDGLTGRVMVDFYTNFASTPVGYNHSAMLEQGFLEKLQGAALIKPASSDIYTTLMAEFVETFATIAVPASHDRHLFFIEGGALAVENALKAAFDWKVRRNRANGIAGEVGTQVLHFKQAFHGRTGYTMSLTNTADPRKTMFFPKFDWPRIRFRGRAATTISGPSFWPSCGGWQTCTASCSSSTRCRPGSV